MVTDLEPNHYGCSPSPPGHDLGLTSAHSSPTSLAPAAHKRVVASRSPFGTLVKDLNIRPETLKQCQEAIGNTLKQICIRKDFLNKTQKAQHQRETMNKWDFIKLKSFCTARETVTRLKRAQGMGENLWQLLI
jgi:hypothetical protein